MVKSFISLNLAGERYDYLYYPKTRTVCTPEFSDIPIVRVHIGCGHTIGHDTVRDLIEEKQKKFEELADLFS